MSDANPVAADWWKLVPCHFIWKLEENVHVHFKGVVNNLDSKLETKNEIEWRESACDMLLFRGYIEVSNFDGVQRNPQKAEEFFLEAEKEAMRVTDDDERQAYITVVTANRLWLLESFHEDNPDEGKQSKLITDLENIWRNGDEPPRKRFDAFIDAIAAFALTRLGPNKYKEAERRYQRALKTIENKSWWYQSLGAVIGRQGRLHIDICDDRYDRIDDEIQYYKKAIELDNQNSSAKCDLALVLLRFPDRKDEARGFMREVEGNSCEIILKKGRFYRREGDKERALKVLLEGENKLQHVRSDIYFMISCLYEDFANQLKRTEEWEKKMEYYRKRMVYLDKCLDREPSHFLAMMAKGIALSRARRFTRGVDMLRGVIEMYRPSPRNLIDAQIALANVFFDHNNKECNEDAAKAYKDVVDTGIYILKNIDVQGNKKIRNLVKRATEILESYYRGLKSGHIKKQTLRNKLSEIGIDD